MTFPNEVADLVAWWHAADLVLSDGAPVASLPDRQGTHDLAQATAERQPVFRPTSAPFSQPAVEFDGTNDFLDAPYSAELNPVAFTFFAKVSVLSNPSGVRGVMASRGFDPNMTGYLVYGGVADDTWQAWLGQTGTTETTSVDSTVTEGAWATLALRASASQGCVLAVDGTPGTTGANFTAPNTASPLRLGAGASESAVGDFFTNMRLAEAFLYARRLSDSEVTELLEYLEAQHESGTATTASTASATASGTSGRAGSASVSATAQTVAQGAKGATGAVSVGSTITMAGSGDGIESPSGTGRIDSVALAVVSGRKSGFGTFATSVAYQLLASGGQVEDRTAASTLGDNTATADLANNSSSAQAGGTLAATYADRTANP